MPAKFKKKGEYIMVLRNAKVYLNEALGLILGMPEVYPFSKKLGLCPGHPCPEIEKIYKVFIVEKDIDSRPKCIFYSKSYTSAKSSITRKPSQTKKTLKICACASTHTPRWWVFLMKEKPALNGKRLSHSGNAKTEILTSSMCKGY